MCSVVVTVPAATAFFMPSMFHIAVALCSGYMDALMGVFSETLVAQLDSLSSEQLHASDNTCATKLSTATNSRRLVGPVVLGRFGSVFIVGHRAIDSPGTCKNQAAITYLHLLGR